MSNEKKDTRQTNQYGKKGNRPRKPFNAKRDSVNLDKVYSNAIEYWNKNMDFANATKFAWDTIISVPKDGTKTIDPVNVTKDYMRQPTVNPANIMVLCLSMGPGWAESTNDGVNRALAQTMATIRANLSTSNIGFETADLGIYQAATSSISAMIGYAKRALESFTLWQDRSYAYPRGILQAMGFTYEDIRANINTYAGKLNSIIDRYNHMRIPDFADVYDRQYVLMHNIYADEDSQLAQLYIFVPDFIYIYKDKTAEGQPAYAEASFTVGVGPKYPSQKFGTFLGKIDEAIDSWYNSSDLYQINGTLLRAFKDAPVQEIPYYEFLSTAEVHVDREHLMQIMNCTIVPHCDDASFNITQDPTTQNYVIYKPTISVAAGATKRTQHMLRIFEDDPTPDDNMEMTRLLTLWESNAGDESGRYLRNCGSEIVTEIFTISYNTVTDTIAKVAYTSNDLVLNDSEIAQQVVERLTGVGPFRYIPMFNVIYQNSTHAHYMGILGDMYNWMLYTKKDWDYLQFVAYESFWKSKLK